MELLGMSKWNVGKKNGHFKISGTTFVYTIQINFEIYTYITLLKTAMERCINMFPFNVWGLRLASMVFLCGNFEHALSSLIYINDLYLTKIGKYWQGIGQNLEYKGKT